MNYSGRRTARGESGQVLVLLVVSLVGLMAITAFAVDFGFIYHAYSELQASANAAATAGALELPATDATTVATSYSGLAGDKNARGDLPGVTMMTGYPQAQCLQTMVNLGLACNNASNANAIAVVEQVTVPTFFARVIGISSMTLKAYALAAMKGGTPTPANITLILDSTRSMDDYDSDPACQEATGIPSPTQLDCAKWGARVLLGALDPCAANLTSCGTVTNGNVPNPVQQVGLLTFPGLGAAADGAYDYNSCGSGMGSQYIYSYAGPPTTSPPYFTIVQPASDYRTSDSASLNGASSDLVKAVDWQNGNNCTYSQYGIQGIGGKGTYYAGVVTEAQSDLSALSAPRNTMQNAIILLSDGAANATCSAVGQYCSAGSDFTTTTPASYGNGECHAAISAAQNAANTQNAAGLYTWVYTVGFGSETQTSYCTTDTASPITPCATLEDMASDLTKFYSDDANGCSAPDHSGITGLSQIFTAISYDFATTRLLPFNTQ
jgi:hypothetical protein